jgi:hypothetical protein
LYYSKIQLICQYYFDVQTIQKAFAISKQIHITLLKFLNYSNIFMTNNKAVKRKKDKKIPSQICEGVDLRSNRGHFCFVKSDGGSFHIEYLSLMLNNFKIKKILIKQFLGDGAVNQISYGANYIVHNIVRINCSFYCFPEIVVTPQIIKIIPCPNLI